MFPLRCVTVLQCLLEPWNLCSVLILLRGASPKLPNVNIFSISSNMSLNKPPPNVKSSKWRLCLLDGSWWLLKCWFSKCLFDLVCWFSPKKSNSLRRSSKFWWKNFSLPPALPPFWKTSCPNWSYSFRLFSSERVSYAEKLRTKPFVNYKRQILYILTKNTNKNVGEFITICYTSITLGNKIFIELKGMTDPRFQVSLPVAPEKSNVALPGLADVELVSISPWRSNFF